VDTSALTVSDSRTKARSSSSSVGWSGLRFWKVSRWVTNPTLSLPPASGITQYQPSGEEMALRPPSGDPGRVSPPCQYPQTATLRNTSCGVRSRWYRVDINPALPEASTRKSPRAVDRSS
jgi:hypothetical protein